MPSSHLRINRVSSYLQCRLFHNWRSRNDLQTLSPFSLEANEIARKLYHSLSSIENYVTTFARVIFLAQKGYGTDEIAFVIHRSSALVAAYRQLYDEFRSQRSAQARLREVLARIREKTHTRGSKKGGRP